MDSINPLAAPNVAMTHIQKMAPGPPVTTAIAIPAILADADAGRRWKYKKPGRERCALQPWSAGPVPEHERNISLTVGNLDKTSAEGEPKADADQKSDQDVGPKDVV